MKNDFVNLLFELGYITENEHRCLLLSNNYDGNRYISVGPNRALFKDSKMSFPFLKIVKAEHRILITVIENGRTVDSMVIVL